MTAGGPEHYERRTREEVARTKGVQDHEAGFITKVVFWHAKRRYEYVLLSIRIRANDPKLLALAELMSRYTSARDAVAPREKRILRLGVSLTRTPSDVCDELYGELRRRFSEREVLELNAAIRWENYRARFNRTFAANLGVSQTACSALCQKNDLGSAIGPAGI